ncbi:MAG: tyrosine-type recombinase/integrase [Campylobacteraceae bacterium]|nr:tyrosine-type recombinase/integrase [Campylobacteraceae bacterium]
MQLINHNGTIYLEFTSTSKIIKKSLKLPYNKKNLAYATKTLLPIFQKLYTITTPNQPTKLKTNPHQRTRPKAIPHQQNKPNQTPTPPQPTPQPKTTKTLSHICHLTLNELKLHSKLTTQHTATYAYKRAFDFLEDTDVHTYTAHTLQTAICEMQKSLSPKTIHLIISYLNLAFKKAINLKLIKENPVQKVKKPRLSKPYKTLLKHRQITTLLTHAQGELKLFLHLAFYTGARSGELLALTKSDINLHSNTLKISKNQTRFELTTTKGGETRTVPLPKLLALFLAKVLPSIKDEKLFQSDYFQIYYKFKKLLKLLNLPPLGLHITRHCYATFLLSNQASPIFVAKNLGHSSLKEVNHTYSHYIFDKKEIRNLEKALNF